MKKKMNLRFMLISAAAIIITAVVSCMLFYGVLRQQLFDDLKAYEMVAAQLVYSSEVNLAQTDVRVTLVSEEGTVLFDSLEVAEKMENHGDRPEIAEAGTKGEGRAVRWSNTLAQHTFYYAKRLEDGSVFRVSKATSSLYNVLWNTGLIICAIALLTFIFCAWISHVLTRRMVEPIEKMAENLERMEEGEVYTEIRPFITTIKEQHINILKHAKVRQDFTANVSHELKTPLTAISGYAELIEAGMVKEEDTRRFAEQIKQNATRLLSLINDIIKLSELDDTELDVKMEPVNLYEIASQCVKNLAVTAENHQVTLSVCGTGTMVEGNPSLLEELVYNLCSNAIRYNKPQGQVLITVKEKEGHATLTVADTGIGIPEDQQKRVFERFYRVDKSHSKETGGTGLGLAIVKHIVAQHEASLQLESELGKGTRITVTF